MYKIGVKGMMESRSIITIQNAPTASNTLCFSIIILIGRKYALKYNYRNKL